MKPIFKHHSLQNFFVLVVGYVGLIFVRNAIQYWTDEEFISATLNGALGYSLFAVLLGFPPFSKL